MALGAAIGWGAYTLPFDWMQKAGLAGLMRLLLGGALTLGVLVRCRVECVGGHARLPCHIP